MPDPSTLMVPPPEQAVTDSVPGEDVKAAPRRRGRPPKASTSARKAQDRSVIPPPTTKAKPSKNDADMRKAAAAFLGWVSAGLALASPLDAAVLEVRTERLAGRMAEVAATNDMLARFLMSAGTGGGWAGLGLELATVGIALAANHGAVPTAVATGVMPEYPLIVEDERKRAASEAAEVQRRRASRAQAF